jgi:CBS domain-containing protein
MLDPERAPPTGIPDVTARGDRKAAIAMVMSVRDVMTRSVISVRPETPLKEVARLLIENGISGMPVVDEHGRVLGVVSEADFLVKEQGVAAVRRRPFARIFGDAPETSEQLAKVAAATAEQAMTSPAITIEAGRPLAEAAARMVSRQVNRLPVTEQGRFVGIVTRADLLRAYLRSDEQLLMTIRDEVLRRAMWLDPDAFEITVENGMVIIAGKVERLSTAEQIAHIVGMVPGVIGIETRLEWSLDDRRIEPPKPDYVSPFVAPRR